MSGVITHKPDLPGAEFSAGDVSYEHPQQQCRGSVVPAPLSSGQGAPLQHRSSEGKARAEPVYAAEHGLDNAAAAPASDEKWSICNNCLTAGSLLTLTTNMSYPLFCIRIIIYQWP